MSIHPHARPEPTQPTAAASVPCTALVPVRPRADGWTPERQREFLEYLADSGSVREAAGRVGMTEQSAYRLRRRSDARDFDALWEAAMRRGTDRLASVAWDRAVNGTVRRRYYHGELIEEERVYDNRMLMWLIARERGAVPLCRARDAQQAVEDWDAALDRVGAPPPPPVMKDDIDLDDDHRVWSEEGCWRTDYPPPPDFAGEQRGRYGQDGYWRGLGDEEARLLETSLREDEERERARREDMRRRAFERGGWQDADADRDGRNGDVWEDMR